MRQRVTVWRTMDEMEACLPDAVEYSPASHIVQLAKLIEPVCDT